MILIADSGSTKTDWVLMDGERKTSFSTLGMNPVLMSGDELTAVLHDLRKQMPLENHCEVFFYGAGCREDVVPKMVSAITHVFPSIHKEDVNVQSDLMGAARALCGKEEGVASILGTGANSCLFDGTRIVANTPALGYVLGDEGSGAVMGRLFVNALYKQRLSATFRKTFEEQAQMSLSTIIQRVYREPMPNRFLASFAPFIHAHLDDDDVRMLCINHFRQFFQYNIAPYHRPDLPVNAVGSVAFHFSDLIREAAKEEGFEMGLIDKSPVEGLVKYHQSVT